VEEKKRKKRISAAVSEIEEEDYDLFV